MDSRGLYRKFTVYRNDGGSAHGAKHEGCRYFVIDLAHDENAAAALAAYAKSCKRKRPALAADLLKLTRAIRQGGGGFASAAAESLMATAKR